MTIQDVTERLRVDTDISDASTVDQAVAAINAGLRATVGSDADAIDVLVALGRNRDDAAFRVRMSHGPMAETQGS